MCSPVLISGGDGFIGRALTAHILSRGTPVLVVDDHSSSTAQPPHPLKETLELDVCAVQLDDLPHVCTILHLASPAAPWYFSRRPLAVIQPNSLGTEMLLRVAARDHCRLLFASSSEVYGLGDPAGRPDQAFREDQVVAHQLLTERSCYSAAKRIGEELVAAARSDGVDAASLRLFNVYGPGMDPTLPGYGRVVPNFVRAAATGSPLPVHGNGTQARSFLWIDDLVAAVLAVLGHAGPLPPAINVGCDEPVTIETLAVAVEDVVGRRLGRRHLPRVPDEPDWRRPDCSLLRSLTGWTPQTSLAEGLWRVVAADLGSTEGCANPGVFAVEAKREPDWGERRPPSRVQRVVRRPTPAPR